jgi:hypothetical protein
MSSLMNLRIASFRLVSIDSGMVWEGLVVIELFGAGRLVGVLGDSGWADPLSYLE